MTTVAYLGPPGTFTDAALDGLRRSGHSAQLLRDATAIAAPSPAEALDMVRQAEATYACVPFENSVDGTVKPTGDALATDPRLQVLAEIELDIAFSILVRPGTTPGDVRVLRTHPIAAAQVRQWVAQHLPGARIDTTSSTAAGAEDVAAGLADATAAPAKAGQINGLESLADHVADIGGARTRFVLIGQPTTPPPPTGNDRTAVLFGLRHEPNSLVTALTELSIRGVDLTRIESRPTREERFTYLFHIDLVGHIDNPVVAEALEALHQRTEGLRFLGSWPISDGSGGCTPPDRSAARQWVEAMAQGQEPS